MNIKRTCFEKLFSFLFVLSSLNNVFLSITIKNLSVSVSVSVSFFFYRLSTKRTCSLHFFSVHCGTEKKIWKFSWRWSLAKTKCQKNQLLPLSFFPSLSHFLSLFLSLSIVSLSLSFSLQGKNPNVDRYRRLLEGVGDFRKVSWV